MELTLGDPTDRITSRHAIASGPTRTKPEAIAWRLIRIGYTNDVLFSKVSAIGLAPKQQIFPTQTFTRLKSAVAEADTFWETLENKPAS